MANYFQPYASCSPSAEKDSYVYKIVPCSGQNLAGITSADEVFVVNSGSLDTASGILLPSPPSQITCLVPSDDGRAVICSGKDEVCVFDLRSYERTTTFKVGKAVTALACKGTSLAVGTEYLNHQAVVSVWDLRQPSAASWSNAENHDDITAIDFHPSKSNIVLAGGDDGQVSIFDSLIAEEQDSLVQGFTHGPIHKAGFLDQNSMYALSSDQNLALHPVFDDARVEEPTPMLLGDLRPVIPCEYVIDVLRTESESVVAAGSHSMSQVDMVPIGSAGSLDLNNRIILQGTHGEEIVRSIFVKDNMIFTAGEDGRVQAYRASSSQSTQKPTKTKKESRYKPY
ncbi:uncharacterized protein HMPREF1541_09188 [Cyphellophora europaea CBS 101466]|uniref:Anaphase-promoting complex subunit 4 WD40 domain-containing protein n=1 Tax=Cyphellophora europaea (strain CBS 101466) TaxID=1220924 RepID=W2S9L1_CYPE1|nr:uncharacterized protein HMPREF1541_09188 [Cyphellophora europaea CBS 101466]ETN45357.1 hypothetical protein HMPREF1541_09188 [Cyphellophora europaea CBS 101466]